ncbi:lipopolysaccharide core heptose(II) kinase RfaY [Chaetomidium leptoderma]|uniref:Lipopolysaccharide core heptose(II) kinase RfaY n=1 Tax=Chaetomidium leptoderma TaxID=669021 RepID=A0AAN6ZYR9_9PEZI|nr:lipopolysaccharide core heptose(II) kinase RfaY [Chaetomidium leptoderma]
MDAANTQPPLRPAAKYEIRLPKRKRPGEPDHYRLSAARLAAPPTKPPPTRPVHPHLLNLHLRPCRVAGFLSHCFNPPPAFIQSWARRIFPEWFLPDHIVLKSQKQGVDELEEKGLFDTEVKAYSRLKPLQGVVIPKFYGLCYHGGARALILEHLPGVSLLSPEGSTLTLEELSALLQPAYRALQAFGVQHDDPHMGNFQLVDGRMMVLDLERVAFDLSEDDMAHFLKTSVEELADRYRSMQAYHRRHGSLEAA